MSVPPQIFKALIDNVITLEKKVQGFCEETVYPEESISSNWERLHDMGILNTLKSLSTNLDELARQDQTLELLISEARKAAGVNQKP